MVRVRVARDNASVGPGTSLAASLVLSHSTRPLRASQELWADLIYDRPRAHVCTAAGVSDDNCCDKGAGEAGRTGVVLFCSHGHGV